MKDIIIIVLWMLGLLLIFNIACNEKHNTSIKIYNNAIESIQELDL